MLFYRFRVPDEENFRSRILHTASDEPHGCLAFWETFCNSRVGLHTYPLGSGRIKGYYEDGTRTKQGSLQHAKVWLFGRYLPDTQCFSGVILFSPLLSLLLTAIFIGACGVSVCGSVDAVIEMIFVLIVTVVLGIMIIRNEAAVYREMETFCR
ncbi:MAG: hypothetical protein ACI3YK_03770 [Eubacteriales bacterium]